MIPFVFIGKLAAHVESLKAEVAVEVAIYLPWNPARLETEFLTLVFILPPMRLQESSYDPPGQKSSTTGKDHGWKKPASCLCSSATSLSLMSQWQILSRVTLTRALAASARAEGCHLLQGGLLACLRQQVSMCLRDTHEACLKPEISQEGCLPVDR